MYTTLQSYSVYRAFVTRNHSIQRIPHISYLPYIQHMQHIQYNVYNIYYTCNICKAHNTGYTFNAYNTDRIWVTDTM